MYSIFKSYNFFIYCIGSAPVLILRRLILMCEINFIFKLVLLYGKQFFSAVFWKKKTIAFFFSLKSIAKSGTCEVQWVEEQLRATAFILKNFANFREKHLRQSLFLKRLQAWRQKQTLQHRYFQVKFAKFLRTQRRWLFLKFFTEQHDSERKGLSTSWKLKIPC